MEAAAIHRRLRLGARRLDRGRVRAIDGKLGDEGAVARRALRGRGGLCGRQGPRVRRQRARRHRALPPGIRSGDRQMASPLAVSALARSRGIGGAERKDLHGRRIHRRLGPQGRAEFRFRVRPGARHLAHSCAHEGRPRLGGGGRARRQDPRHRRPRSRRQHGRDARGLRSGDQYLEGSRRRSPSRATTWRRR